MSEGPDDGHTFRISYQIRGSSMVVGDEHHTDAPAFSGIVTTVEVRAWDLKAALRKVLDMPFAELADVGNTVDLTEELVTMFCKLHGVDPTREHMRNATHSLYAKEFQALIDDGWRPQ